MNIGFYGPSIALYHNRYEWHFINLIRDRFKAKIVHSGIPQCSEERILFNLKKTKNLDLAIIFHAPPYNIFIPSWNRDISNIDKDTFGNKITLRKWMETAGWDHIDSVAMENFSKNFEEKVVNGACFQLLENYDIHFENYSEVFDQWASGNSNSILELLKEKLRRADQDQVFYEGLWKALEYFKKYMQHPDLQMNRYYGALIQIDQYLSYKNIPCVHIVDKEKWYPNWVEFRSGPVDKEIQKIHIESSPHWIGYSESENALDKEGNKKIFDKIMDLLAVSSIEVDAPGDQSGDGGSSPPTAPIQGLYND